MDNLQRASISKNVELQRSVMRALQEANGWITDDEIAARIESNERAVRLVIRELRRAGKPIASESGKGYLWALNDAEAMRVTIAEFRSRGNDLFETARAMERNLYPAGKKQAEQMSAGQMGLV